MPDITEKASAALAERLAAIRAHYVASDPDMVADVVRAILASMSGDLTAKETTLLTEVRIARPHDRRRQGGNRRVAGGRHHRQRHPLRHRRTRRDRRSIPPRRRTRSWKPAKRSTRWREHLDGEPATQLQDATTRIYEACGFQDITGQRITKVVNTLKVDREPRLAQLVATFGESNGEAAASESRRARRC